MTAHSLELTRDGLIAALWQAAAPAGNRGAVPAAPPHEDDDARRLAAAIHIYDNEDALARRLALQAAAAGRPAFWTTAGYHSQKHCALQLAVHGQPTVEAALDQAALEGSEARLAALDTLVPLNRPALAVLALAYAGLGRWRDIADLEARCLSDMRAQEP
jgi:hypothetical protein